jgi:hypothetical protein
MNPPTARPPFRPPETVWRPIRAEPPTLGAVLVGAALPLPQVPCQIAGDDGWHGPQTARYGRSGRGLSRFGENDRCIPRVGLARREIRCVVFHVAQHRGLYGARSYADRHLAVCEVPRRGPERPSG